MQTPLGGKGMEFVLGSRQYALNGVLNGIDGATWSPTCDTLIPHTYTKDDLAGKRQCKAALQKELGLPQDAERPLIAFIGRLDGQKGADLILSAAPWIMKQARPACARCPHHVDCAASKLPCTQPHAGSVAVSTRC